MLYHSRELHRQLHVPFVEPPRTARQAQTTQPPSQKVPSTDKFSMDLPPAASTSLSRKQPGRAKDTVLAILMDESDPHDVGQRDRNAQPYFDSDSDVSEVRHDKKSKPARRRIQTPSDPSSSSSDSDSRSVIEVSDEESEEESTRYRVKAKRQPVKGSKEVELGLGSGDASDSDNVIDVDEDSDGIEIVDEQPAAASNAVPVIHFAETTSRSGVNKQDNRHSFKPSDTLHQGRHTAQKARDHAASSTAEERVSPPLKRSKTSRNSRQQFWQSKSGVETNSGRRDEDGDRSGQFEDDWQEDLDRARLEATGRDAVAANDDFIAF